MFHAKPAIVFAAVVAALVAIAHAQHTVQPAHDAAPDWQRLLADRLPAYGHRNWIVVADSAYPSQSGAGIETVVTKADHLQVLGEVLDSIESQRHIRATIYLDAELQFVSERDAPKIDRYRNQLARMFELIQSKAQSVNHEQIIDKLDSAGKKFNILVLKTNLTLPYTSVFIELDCDYWSAEQEQRLRDAMKDAQ